MDCIIPKDYIYIGLFYFVIILLILFNLITLFIFLNILLIIIIIYILVYAISNISCDITSIRHKNQSSIGQQRIIYKGIFSPHKVFHLTEGVSSERHSRRHESGPFVALLFAEWAVGGVVPQTTPLARGIKL